MSLQNPYYSEKQELKIRRNKRNFIQKNKGRLSLDRQLDDPIIKTV